MDLLNYIFSVAPMSYQAEAQEHPDHEGCHQHERCEARRNPSPPFAHPLPDWKGRSQKPARNAECASALAGHYDSNEHVVQRKPDEDHALG